LTALSGCGPGKESSEAETITPRDPNAVVATVNGNEITAGPVDAILARRVATFERQTGRRMSFRDQERQRRMLIEQLVEEELVREAVAASTISVSAAALDQRMQRVAAEFGGPDELEAYLQQVGYTLDEFKEDARVDLEAQAVMEAAMGFQPTTPQEARAYYDEHPEQFAFPDSVAVNHILLTIPADASAQSQTQTVERLRGIRNEILNGLSFSNAAVKYSECPSAERGGYLGYVSSDDDRISELFAARAFNLPVSNVSDVVETEYGAHLIYVTDRTPAHTAAFDEIEVPIRDFLDERKRRDMIKEWTHDLRSKAKVEYP
jgi:parvulin-like peptidyl-prolyl isomerase